jgi:hypothetical protein
VRHYRARIEKTFHRDIEGHGSVQMLAVRAAEGAGYVAVEYITGAVHGRVGGFSLLHAATSDATSHAGAGTWARWPVVPGSGTGYHPLWGCARFAGRAASTSTPPAATPSRSTMSSTELSPNSAITRLWGLGLGLACR